MVKHVSNIFIAGAVFGALSCFSRADYNLPLYAFAWLMWDQGDNSERASDDKFKIMILLAVSWVGDLLWMFYWIPYWNSSEMKDWQKGVHSFVIFFSAVNFLMKVIFVALMSLDRSAYHAWIDK